MKKVQLSGGITAVKYDGTNRREMKQWMTGASIEEARNPAKIGKVGFAIATETGKLSVSEGQWVVNLGHAVFMPLTPEQAILFGLEIKPVTDGS